MDATPLQKVLGIHLIRQELRVMVQATLLIVALLVAFAIRRRRFALSATTFILMAAGLLLDVVSIAMPAANAVIAQKVAAASVVLFLFGVIRLVLEAIDAATRRGESQFSTIFKDLMMFSGWAIVVGAVLYTDFGVQPLSILTTTTVVSLVVGLALQETLSNIFSGLMMQLSKPFERGDWVRSGNYIGRVLGIGWRSTVLMTRAHERLDVPNTLIGKDVLINYAEEAIADEVSVGISYEVPPNRVREVIARVLHDLPHVQQKPAPEILPWEYGDSAIRYRVKFWISDYGLQEQVHADVVSNLWYALRRHHIEIPFPTRTLELRHARRSRSAESEYETEVMAELRKIDFLHDLDESELRMIVPTVQVHQFGARETLMRQGDPGETMYIIRHGTVEVVAHSEDGPDRHVAELGSSQIIGEAALFTGEPRNTTIRALTDVEVLEIGREGFTQLFRQNEQAAHAISEIVSTRLAERMALFAESIEGEGKSGRRRWLYGKMREILDF